MCLALSLFIHLAIKLFFSMVTFSVKLLSNFRKMPLIFVLGYIENKVFQIEEIYN